MNVTSEDLAVSPSSSSQSSTSSNSSALSASLRSPSKPMAMSSPSQTSSKRPNLGEMMEAPNQKKVHQVPLEWAHWRPADPSSGHTVDQELYGGQHPHSHPEPSAAALQGMEMTR